jgi:hypothetical protein
MTPPNLENSGDNSPVTGNQRTRGNVRRNDRHAEEQRDCRFSAGANLAESAGFGGQSHRSFASALPKIVTQNVKRPDGFSGAILSQSRHKSIKEGPNRASGRSSLDIASRGPACKTTYGTRLRFETTVGPTLRASTEDTVATTEDRYDRGTPRALRPTPRAPYAEGAPHAEGRTTPRSNARRGGTP